jgi:S1-C subfamily serine protease
MKEESVSPLAALSESLADAVEKIEPSLVRIRSGRRWPASGVVYAGGLVLTTAHALEREEDLTVDTPEGKSLSAAFAGRDTRNDLAVLRVEGLEAAAAVPANIEARVGGIALAAGRPSRRGVRVSMGVVSAAGSGQRGGGRGHGHRGGAMPERYLQTDAAPYPGLGGGALVDTAGVVIGVVTAGTNGATLAVPAGLAWEVAGTLAEGGTLKRGYLGVYSQPVRLPGGRETGLTQEGGLLVVGVGDHTPASRAGIMVGDILATLGGQPVEDTEDLLTLLGPGRVGEDVAVQLMRGGALTKLEVNVGERD